MARSGLFKLWATVLAAMLAAILLSATSFMSGAGAQEPPCTGQVVLDPGHGGTDSGAVNTKYDLAEKAQSLDIALRLRALLESDGYAVCMTRTTDKTLSNNDRYSYANTTGAGVLVSIHMNGSSNSSHDYTTTLFGKWRKDKELATTVFESLSALPAAGATGTIATKQPYSFASGVLLKSEMPATIAETVFITSDREGQLLSDGTGTRQQQIAEALKVGVENYLTPH